MPRALAWGSTIDAVELSPSTAIQSSRPRTWEIRAKAGGGTLGIVRWHGPSRAYVFEATHPAGPSIYLFFEGAMLLDIGKFCQSHTQSHLLGRKAAAG